MNLNPRTNRATVSIERGSPGNRCSVVGMNPSGTLNILQTRVHVQPLGSTVITRFFATMDCPTPAEKNPLRVSQVPRPICPHAPPPTTPESPMAALSVTRPSVSGFIRSDGLATPNTLTRLNRVRLRCGSQVCLARLRVADCSHSTRLRGYVDERIISTVNSFQFTR